MPAWLPPVLCVEAAAWAAFFAQLGHGWRADRPRAEACARIALCCLIAATGFRLMAVGTPSRLAHGERAARAMQTALGSPRAPMSFPAAARDSDHRSVTFPARDDR